MNELHKYNQSSRLRLRIVEVKKRDSALREVIRVALVQVREQKVKEKRDAA